MNHQKNDYIKMIIAMNDVSKCLSLGYKLNNESFIILNQDARVYYHYIDILNDSGELKRSKMLILYENIKKMDNELYKKLEDYYPGVIHDILSELINLDTNVSEKVMKRVYEWWN